jgi:hypothetical protein
LPCEQPGRHGWEHTCQSVTLQGSASKMTNS